MNSVNMLAEFVEVEAAHIETPISHHGIERPERKKSLASLPARREHSAAMPKSAAKKSPIATKSTTFILMPGLYNKHTAKENKQNRKRNIKNANPSTDGKSLCYNFAR